MKVFVSYSHHDRDRVEPLVRALEANNLSVFWDPEIPVGTPTYNKYLEERLNEADRAIVIWTAASVSSSWVIEEANEALRRGILLPVRLDDAEPPLGFRSVQTLDLRGWSWKTPNRGIDGLVDALSGRPIRAPKRAFCIPTAKEMTTELPSAQPSAMPSVIQAYERMKRVLARLEKSPRGQSIKVDGIPIEEKLVN